jgi:asparagine synthase (glutamine-hydrolysing)
MCGIAGIASLTERPVREDEVRAMCRTMVHRGPDDEGIYLGPGVGLGMRRLSIIDLATGDQPISNEDGTVWVVFNGEIYNFAELRAELRQRGHVLRTRGDTETIVHLYEEYGVRCVEHLRGMFAFALWDERKRQLLLARDRVGIKPLYYAESGGRLLFASELRAFLSVPEIETRLNWRAMNRLFTFVCTPLDASILEGINKLPPGHLLVAQPGRPPRIERYWDVRFAPDYGRSEEYFVDGLRGLLEESVRLHLASDVPLGAFLSGGIDSSAVVATMARLVSTPVKTFSIGFKEAAFNEAGYARLVAERFGTEHHELILEPNVLDILDELTRYLDEPFGDPSAVPTYMVSRLAARHVKVVLSGDGGDELFAGYDRYLVEGRERAAELPAPLRRLLGRMVRHTPEGMRGRNFLRRRSLSGLERYLDNACLFSRDALQRLFEPEAFAKLDVDSRWRESREFLDSVPEHWLSALQYHDIKTYLPLDILTKVDRMSMAHSIEARVPLLDHKLIEFAATIPPELQLRHGTGKYIFKRALRGILPPEIIDRSKRGFAVPLAWWFRGPAAGFLRDLLLSDRSRQRGLFNPAYVERLIARQASGRNLDWPLWVLVSFELWCRTFIDGRAGVPDGPYALATPPVNGHGGGALSPNGSASLTPAGAPGTGQRNGQGNGTLAPGAPALLATLKMRVVAPTLHRLAYSSGASTVRARSLRVGRILLIHGVDDLDYPAAALEALLRYLRRNFTIVPLPDLVRHLTEGEPPAGQGWPVSITFDDGLRNNATVAYPILRRWEAPATFFVCPGLIEERRWPWTYEVAARLASLGAGQRRALARDLHGPEAGVDALKNWLKRLPDQRRADALDGIRALTPRFVPTAEQRRRFDPMTWDELRALDPGLITVGSHAVTHPILPSLAPEQAHYEIVESRRWLETQLERPIEYFCYPDGAHDDLVVQTVRATYRGAVIVAGGFVKAGDDPHRLRRIWTSPGLPDQVWRLHRPTA